METEADIGRKPDAIKKLEDNDKIKTPLDELENVILFIHWPYRKVYIGINLSPEQKYKLI